MKRVNYAPRELPLWRQCRRTFSDPLRSRVLAGRYQPTDASVFGVSGLSDFPPILDSHTLVC